MNLLGMGRFVTVGNALKRSAHEWAGRCGRRHITDGWTRCRLFDDGGAVRFGESGNSRHGRRAGRGLRRKSCRRYDGRLWGRESLTRDVGRLLVGVEFAGLGNDGRFLGC